MCREGMFHFPQALPGLHARVSQHSWAQRLPTHIHFSMRKTTGWGQNFFNYSWNWRGMNLNFCPEGTVLEAIQFVRCFEIHQGMKGAVKKRLCCCYCFWKKTFSSVSGPKPYRKEEGKNNSRLAFATKLSWALHSRLDTGYQCHALRIINIFCGSVL